MPNAPPPDYGNDVISQPVFIRGEMGPTREPDFAGADNPFLGPRADGINGVGGLTALFDLNENDGLAPPRRSQRDQVDFADTGLAGAGAKPAR